MLNWNDWLNTLKPPHEERNTTMDWKERTIKWDFSRGYNDALTVLEQKKHTVADIQKAITRYNDVLARGTSKHHEWYIRGFKKALEESLVQ